MKYLVFSFCFMCFACTNAESLREAKSTDLSFFLNTYEVLLSKKNPDEFPSKVSLIHLPDKTDDCSRYADVELNLEDLCPAKILYLSLSNWDLMPDYHTFVIGSANSWRVVDLVVEKRLNQSDWVGKLSLQAEKLVNGKVQVENLVFQITNKYDVYNVVRI